MLPRIGAVMSRTSTIRTSTPRSEVGLVLEVVNARSLVMVTRIQWSESCGEDDSPGAHAACGPWPKPLLALPLPAGTFPVIVFPAGTLRVSARPAARYNRLL
jgi:hypothetical protein